MSMASIPLCSFACHLLVHNIAAWFGDVLSCIFSVNFHWPTLGHPVMLVGPMRYSDVATRPVQQHVTASSTRRNSDTRLSPLQLPRLLARSFVRSFVGDTASAIPEYRPNALRRERRRRKSGRRHEICRTGTKRWAEITGHVPRTA